MFCINVSILLLISMVHAASVKLINAKIFLEWSPPLQRIEYFDKRNCLIKSLSLNTCMFTNRMFYVVQGHGNQGRRFLQKFLLAKWQNEIFCVDFIHK